MKLSLSLPLLLLLSLPLMAAEGHVYRDSEGAISVYGIEPNAQIRVGIDTPPSRTITSNRCGLLVVSASENYPMATIQVGGVTINPAILPTQIKPTCRQQGSTYLLDEERPQHFVTADSDLVVVGKAPNTRYEVTYPGQLRLLTRSVNACGFLRVRETETINFNQSILLPTTSATTYAEFQIDEIPQTIPLLCQRGVLYYPQPWTDIFARSIPGTEVAASVVESVRSIPSAVASAGSGVTGGSGTGGTSGGSGGTSGSSGSGSSGDGGTSGSSGSSGSSGETGGTSGGAGESSGSGGTSGSPGGTPNPSLYDFTDATYNASLHDYNGDGLVDDANGDGIPDDRDNDGHPDGRWGPGDIPRSAGPGLTIPMNANFCYGYNGNLVASSWGLTRNGTYKLWGDDGLAPVSNGMVEAQANAGATTDAPTIRFAGDYRASNYSHSLEGSTRGGGIYDSQDYQVVSFYWQHVPSCLMPTWFQP